MDCTKSTIVYFGSSVRSFSPGSLDSDAQSLCSAAPLGAAPCHFRENQDSLGISESGELIAQGDVMAEWFAMVHLPIPMKKAQSIPRAKAKVDEEWNSLASMGP